MADTPKLDLPSLIKTVDQTAPSSDPLDRLSTAVTLGEGVNALADALLDHYVELARTLGHSWTEIGNAIGVSKQAVQQRFVSAANLNTERLTDRARTVLAHAEKEARRQDHNFIGVEHLLAGLMLEGEGVAGVVLKELGLTTEKVQAAITRHIGPTGSKAPTGALSVTPRSKRLIADLVVKEALALGHNYIGTEHFLLAMCSQGDSMGAAILKEEVGELTTIRAAVLTKIEDMTKKKKGA